MNISSLPWMHTYKNEYHWPSMNISVLYLYIVLHTTSLPFHCETCTSSSILLPPLTIPYNTANILAMYKGTANSPNKVWYGGENLYWECPDRDDGHLPKFCNWKLEYLRGDKHCSCTKKWQQHLHTRPHVVISHSYASTMVSLHILTYKCTLFPIICMHTHTHTHLQKTEKWHNILKTSSKNYAHSS